MPEARSSETISTRLERIANLAKENPTRAFTSLAHHLDIEWMREAHARTRKGGAAGIDGMTAAAYASNLETNLLSLLDRAKSGLYRAPPVRRVWIPKGKGQQRPLGIPTYEDKILQRAVTMLLEAIYEQDFLSSSHGFRPRRSAHSALNLLRNQIMSTKGGWILEVDIKQFFDALDHHHLQTFLRRRVRDGVLLRLLGKWLNAGVMENGVTSPKALGTPQGGVISPLLANIYLHEVLDTWFESDVKPRLKGDGFLCRYADDFVLLFKREDDARRVLTALSKRFGKFGLTLHPGKTRLVPFHRPLRLSGWRHGIEPSSFVLLGFTHVWARSRLGHWIVRLRTAPDRMSRALRNVREWCRRHRHQKVKEQHAGLVAKMRGHFGYFGITGNFEALARFREEVESAWFKWLSRRSDRRLSRDHWRALLKHHPLPQPRIMRAFTASDIS
jgi:group II intron reverse transcriptase/maturase